MNGLSDAERSFLAGATHGRLATIGPGGWPQVKPVGFRFDEALGAIDIAGYGMEQSAKYRNLQADPRAAFVLDDVIGPGAGGTRFLEVRGRVELLTVDRPSDGLSPHLIRLHPRRVISWNVGAPGLHRRDLPGDDAGHRNTPQGQAS